MYEMVLLGAGFVSSLTKFGIVLGILALVFALPAGLGVFLARTSGKPERGWIFGGMLVTIACFVAYALAPAPPTAETENVELATSLQTLFGFIRGMGIFGAVIVAPFAVGSLIASGVRMADYWWKLGTIFSTLACSVAIIYFSWNPEKGKFDIPLGVDLKGGVILVYEVDLAGEEEGAPDQRLNMDDLVKALSQRINPSGTKEIVVRKYGVRQVEIIIPEVDPIEVDYIKRMISTAGSLEFQIVANMRDHEASVIQQAKVQAQDPARRRAKEIVVRSADGSSEQIGFWARVGRESPGGPFKIQGVEGDILRDARTGEMLDLGQVAAGESFQEYLTRNDIDDIDVLMAINEDIRVRGDDLGAVSRSVDEYLRPCVNFRLKAGGAPKFGLLTSQNLPDRDANFFRRLGIVLDEQLLSAPQIQSRISDSGRITGQFTDEEVDFLVSILRSGRLPATLQKTPISENQIGSMLGDDTIEKGKWAIGISMVAVLIFVAIYYRFAGLVACLALVANLVVIIALMILLNAPLTLPGMAGLVLTVGMSVDANVLIFERIREELNRGAALRMAIRNGFDRATTTIVDANVTTLITALVLYAIGTDQIRGFAVTLILGIMLSMFTAIFCSRVIFDMSERSRFISKLVMMRLLGATAIDFIGKRRIAFVVSNLLIIAGLVGVAWRKQDIFDIDFTGGTSVTMMLNSAADPEDVRAALRSELGEGAQFTVNTVSVENHDANTVFKIDSALDDVASLQGHIRNAFSGQLATYAMQVSAIRSQSASAGGTEAEATSGQETDPSTEKQSAAGKLPLNYVALTTPQESTTGPPAAAQGDEKKAGSAGDQKSADADQAGATPPGETTPPAEAGPQETTDDPAGGQKAAPAEATELTTAELTFTYPINAPALVERIRNTSQAIEEPITDIRLDSPDRPLDWTMESSASFKRWTLTTATPQKVVADVLARMESDLAGTPVWPSSSKIGGKVAGDTQNLAIAALLASLLGIIGYIWIRFQRVVFGLAAVVALVHDVLITLGAIAASAWFANALGFLLIEEFKISLPVVAAFLTIIGYSLNDTIVVFDRIREVRGKSPELTEEMINQSINQTLSRTLLTSLTTLGVVMILYWFGGQGIHGFAFALVVGVLVGTYSSIFVASPTLLWMMNRSTAAKARSAA